MDLLVATQPWQGSQLYEEMISKGMAPRVLVRSLYCTRLIEEDAAITDVDQLIAENNPADRVGRLIESSNPIMRIQMWAWDALKVPWVVAFDHTDPDTHDVFTGWIQIEQNGGDVRELVEDRKKFNWESLLMAPPRKQDSQTTEQHLSTADSETSND